MTICKSYVEQATNGEITSPIDKADEPKPKRRIIKSPIETAVNGEKEGGNNNIYNNIKLSQGEIKEKVIINNIKQDEEKTSRARDNEPIQIREDKHNYRLHSDENLRLIGKSLDENGVGRSIVADADGNIIGGNGTFREAKKRGIPIKTVETNGDELVCVVRKDLRPDDPRRAKLAVLDNSTTDSSMFDYDALQMDFQPLELEEMGIELPINDECENAEDAQENNPYTKKTDIPQYVPTGANVDLSQCFDLQKTNELINEINDSNVSPEEKEFLIEAAKRHSVFNYKNIAEYYASKATPEMQNLMEKSALVLIDFEDAIKYGFVKLTKEIEAIREADDAE